MKSGNLDVAQLFGFMDAARPKISKASLKEGKSAKESADLGKECLDDGDCEGAIKHYRMAIKQSNGSDAKLLVDLGAALEVADREFEALQEYSKAANELAANPEPHVGLADVYKRFGRFRDSISELERAISLEPNNAFYHFKLAEVLRELKAFEHALPYVQKAAEIAPEDSFYHFWLGDLLIDMKRFDQAIRALRNAVERSPGDDYLLLRTSVAFWGAGRTKEAIQAVRLASDLDPDKELYHGVLALYLRNAGDKDEAKLASTRAEKIDSYDREQVKRIAEFLGLQR